MTSGGIIDSYEKGKSAKFITTAKADTIIVTNANIQWSSSDTSKATVDVNGNVLFISDGTVAISALWVEHKIITTKLISITVPVAYEFGINGTVNTYLTTDTPTLTTTAYKNGVVDTTATITWVSSDVSKATIDGTGKITFLAAGDVTMTATWTEQNVTATKNILITVPVPTTSYTCKITNTLTTPTEYNDTTNIIPVKVSGSLKPIVAHFYDGTGTEVTTLTPVWSIDVSSLTTAQQAEVHLTYQESYPLRCYLNADNDVALVGLNFYLTLVDSGALATSKTVPVNITSYT